MNTKWMFPTLGIALAYGVGRVMANHRANRQIRDRVVLITGGSRGLGLALGREFGRRGCRIVLLARDELELARAQADLAARGISCATYACDLGTSGPIRETVAAVAADLGGIDILVNNAGTMLVAPFDLMDDADFETAMDLHFWAPYHLIKAALPHLRRSPSARIVNIASIGGHVAVPHMAPYSASKFALVGLSDALRAELAADKIRVTTIAPGLMRTGSHIHALFKGDAAGEYAWFATSASLPLVSMDAARAARQIVNAAQCGRRELTVGVAAKSARMLQGMFPRAIAGIIALAGRFFPQTPSHASHAAQPGRVSRGKWLPEAFTWLADRAIPRFNE